MLLILRIFSPVIYKVKIKLVNHAWPEKEQRSHVLLSSSKPSENQSSLCFQNPPFWRSGKTPPWMSRIFHHVHVLFRLISILALGSASEIMLLTHTVVNPIGLHKDAWNAAGSGCFSLCLMEFSGTLHQSEMDLNLKSAVCNQSSKLLHHHYH